MAENPYLARRIQHRIGKAGRASEKRMAKALDGRPRPASGAMEGAKGDIDLGSILMEAKSTTQGSITLKLDWLLKITQEARNEGKTPALAVSFVHENGDPRMDGEYVLVPMRHWKANLR